jgi:hypothetical protein
MLYLLTIVAFNIGQIDSATIAMQSYHDSARRASGEVNLTL